MSGRDALATAGLAVAAVASSWAAALVTAAVLGVNL